MSNDRKTIDADGAPEAVGPYSHAVASGGLLFCSGQIPLDPESGEIVGDDAAGPGDPVPEEPRRPSARRPGTGLDRAVRLTIYTTELDRFAEINEAYAEFFPVGPARPGGRRAWPRCPRARSWRSTPSWRSSWRPVDSRPCRSCSSRFSAPARWSSATPSASPARSAACSSSAGSSPAPSCAPRSRSSTGSPALTRS